MKNKSFEDFKRTINTEADVYAIFSDLNIKKIGDGWKANCPFHDDKTPSFIIVTTHPIMNNFTEIF